MVRNNRTRLKRQRKKTNPIRIGAVIVLSSVIFWGAGRFAGGVIEAIVSDKSANKNSNITFEESVNEKMDSTSNTALETALNNDIKQSIDVKQSNDIEQSSKKNEWNLILINPWNLLPENYDVEMTKLSNGHFIDERAYPDLQEMMDNARAEGLSPIICSSYRTLDKQISLFNNQLDRYLAQGYSRENAETEAAKWVAVPGTSEHHTGLALDIVSVNNQRLEKEQENTPEQKWLMQNSYKYGFILRFPEDKTDITGINYEPWHYRYVGKVVAKEIYERDICLEEYLEG